MLNTPLFVRRGPRISLTAEGHALIEYADRMLDTAGELVERFRTRDPLKGMLRLGLNESFALICLPELLKRLEQQYPGIRTSVFVGDTGLVSQRAQRKALDIAVVSEPEGRRRTCRWSRIGSNASDGSRAPISSSRAARSRRPTSRSST